MFSYYSVVCLVGCFESIMSRFDALLTIMRISWHYAQNVENLKKRQLFSRIPMHLSDLGL